MHSLALIQYTGKGLGRPEGGSCSTHFINLSWGMESHSVIPELVFTLWHIMNLLGDVLNNENLKKAKILALNHESTLECWDADGDRPVCGEAAET